MWLFQHHISCLFSLSYLLLSKLTSQVNEFLKDQATDQEGYTPITKEEVALGFIRVANEAMCRPIRALTQVKNSNNLL